MTETDFDLDKALSDVSAAFPDEEWAPASVRRAAKSPVRVPSQRRVAGEEVAGEAWPSLPLEGSAGGQGELARRMSGISSQYRTHGAYAKVRDEFVMTSLALNEIGLLAPAFRDQPLIPAMPKDRTASHRRLLIDQIVIDCHWLHCREEQVQPSWSDLHAIFSAGAAFDCRAIEERLAARTWTAQFRTADLLLLTDRQQAQLRQLRTTEMRESHAGIFYGSRSFDYGAKKSRRTPARIVAVRLAINNWADRVHQVRDQKSVYQALWAARELLGPAATYGQIAELAGLQCGRPPLQPKTTADKLKVLDRVLAAAGIS